jgi:hypothetical protein
MEFDLFTEETATIITAYAGLLTVLIACIAAIFSFVATMAARKSTELSSSQMQYNRKARIMDIHSRFQLSMRELQRQLPAAVNDDNWDPNDNEKRIITLYWYLVFDEWFTCTGEDPDLNSLWDRYYYHGVKSALRIPAFENGITKLFSGDSTFLGMGREFSKVIKEIQWEVNGRDLGTA